MGAGLNLWDMSSSETVPGPSTAASSFSLAASSAAPRDLDRHAHYPTPHPHPLNQGSFESAHSVQMPSARSEAGTGGRGGGGQDADGLEAQAKLRRRMLDAEGKALVATQQQRVLQDQLLDAQRQVGDLERKVSEQGATIEGLLSEASQAQYEVRHARNKAAELEQQLQESLDTRHQNARELQEARVEISRLKAKEGHDRDWQADLDAASAAARDAQEELAKCSAALETANADKTLVLGELENAKTAQEKAAAERDALAAKATWLHSEVHASREGCEEMEAREREREAEWQENVRLYNAEIEELQRELACARDKERTVKSALTLAEDERASLARTREEQTRYCESLRFEVETKSQELSGLTSALQHAEGEREALRDELRLEREAAGKGREVLLALQGELTEKEERARELQREREHVAAALRGKDELLLQHRAAAAVSQRARQEGETQLAVERASALERDAAMQMLQEELEASRALHAAATQALEAEEETLLSRGQSLVSAMHTLQVAVVNQGREREREKVAASLECLGLEERLVRAQEEKAREREKVEMQGQDFLQLSNNLREGFERQLQQEEDKQRELREQICQLLLENQEARAAAQDAAHALSSADARARGRDVAFAAFEERERVLQEQLLQTQQELRDGAAASAQDRQHAAERLRCLEDEGAVMQEDSRHTVAAAERLRDEALAQVRVLREELGSREQSCEQALSLFRQTGSELQDRLAALHMDKSQQVLEVAALQEQVRVARLAEREAIEARRELERVGKAREQQGEREREEWRFRNSSLASVAHELGAVVRAGQEEVERLASAEEATRKVIAACQDQARERERVRETEKSALQLQVLVVARDKQREREEDRAKWEAVRGRWEREREVLVMEMEKLVVENQSLARELAQIMKTVEEERVRLGEKEEERAQERLRQEAQREMREQERQRARGEEREEERKRAEWHLLQERAERQRERAEEKATLERERERLRESACERGALADKMTALHREMATLGADKDRCASCCVPCRVP